MKLSDLKCRFGCDAPPVGVFHLAKGCVCFPDRIQALCEHHLNKSTDFGGLETIVDFRRQVIAPSRPSTADWRIYWHNQPHAFLVYEIGRLEDALADQLAQADSSARHSSAKGESS